MEDQVLYNGPEAEVSMPATQFGNVSTQEPSVLLFPCTKYKHPKSLPTGCVLEYAPRTIQLRIITCFLDIILLS